MPSLSALAMGKQALLSYRAALETIGHNMANVTTPGYSRQKAELTTGNPITRTFGAIGTGVDVKTISRIADDYIEGQVRSAQSGVGEYQVLEETYAAMESFFNELTDQDLSTAINDFFSSLHDLANNVESPATRNNVIQTAEVVADTVNETYANMVELRARLNGNVENAVGVVNTLLRDIADLNLRITAGEVGGSTNISANDLRDSRNAMLKELASYIEIDVEEFETGALGVTINGITVVFADDYRQLDMVTEVKDGMAVKLIVYEDDQSDVYLGSGKLKGLIDARDTIVPSYINELNEFSGSFIYNFNKVHAEGLGLVGRSSSISTNKISSATEALNLVTFDFTPPASDIFTMKNGSFTVKVKNTVTGEIDEHNIDVDLDGFDNDDTTLTSLAAAIDAIANISATVNSRNQIEITADNSDITFWFGPDTSGVLASLGINSFFEGFDARTMAIHPEITADDRLVAAGVTDEPGDNVNVMNLIALREFELLDNGTKSFDDFYESMIGRLGIESDKSINLAATRNGVLKRMENQRESLSGVSLDEEMTYMIQYQRTYQGAAKFIHVMDTLLDTLIGM